MQMKGGKGGMVRSMRGQGLRGATMLSRVDDVGGERGQCTVMWLDMGKAGSEGDRQGHCPTTWSDMGKAGGEGNVQGQCMGEVGEEGEGEHDATENCEDDGWQDSEG
jgi:hypothetical protein